MIKHCVSSLTTSFFKRFRSFGHSPNSVATLRVLTVVVKAWWSFKVVSSMSGKFGDPYGTKVPGPVRSRQETSYRDLGQRPCQKVFYRDLASRSCIEYRELVQIAGTKILFRDLLQRSCREMCFRELVQRSCQETLLWRSWTLSREQRSHFEISYRDLAWRSLIDLTETLYK